VELRAAELRLVQLQRQRRSSLRTTTTTQQQQEVVVFERATEVSFILIIHLLYIY
jgi:hypothetical protein